MTSSQIVCGLQTHIALVTKPSNCTYYLLIPIILRLLVLALVFHEQSFT